MVTNHRKPEALGELSKTFTVGKFLDQFPTYLREVLGRMEELIRYTPHTGPAYESDNARVYALLLSALSSSSAMASITRYQRTRNGREAYPSLVTHNMGSSK